ncbi:MAG: epoxyqueuosine reductase QueH, partial [Coprobacillus sp.]
NGYLKSTQMTKEYDMYRQNYCGCMYSYQDMLNRENDE